MEKEKEQRLMSILNEKGTASERKAKIEALFNNTLEGCQRSYSENSRVNPDCKHNQVEVQGVVSITNCPDPSDNKVLEGQWHCR